MKTRHNLFFSYLKKSIEKTKIFSILLTTIGGLGSFISIYSIACPLWIKLLIPFTIVFIIIVALLYETAILASTDVEAPKIRSTIEASVYRNQYDILFLTESPICSTMFGEGSTVTLILKQDDIENNIGFGVILNIQGDGKLHLGVHLFDYFKSHKNSIKNELKNIYFIPYKETRG